ncbi:hypothetical protein GCM10027446_01200 [Angustibacter peucedani]
MTIVRIQCPTCRAYDDVPAPALMVDADDLTDHLTEDHPCAAAVTWICAGCDGLVDVPVEWATLPRLVCAGAALLEAADITDPSDTTDASDAREATDPSAAVATRRPLHPERPPTGPPLTLDDLLDFHQLLAASHWQGPAAGRDQAI